MCCNYSKIRETENGLLVYLKGCNNFQLTYKNLNFNLSEKELTNLLNFLIKVDIDYWEKEYQHSIYEKKIPIPTLQANFIILLNRFELNELIYLLGYEKKSVEIKFKDIVLPMHWN